MSIETAEDFWGFATGLYAHDPIKRQCLQLQDDHTANVNIVLWLCWLDTQKIGLSKEALTQAKSIVANTCGNATEQLRAARSELKSNDNFTRVQQQMICKHILAAELAIEKVCIQRLQDYTRKMPALPENEDSLSLFDYLNDMNVTYCGQIAALLLEQARLFSESHDEAATAF